MVLEAGIDLALANKESVVMAGPVIFEMAKKSGSRILPVDSEHSAIFTLLNSCGGSKNVGQLIITASGGPFRTWPSEKIANATLKDALKHPTWDMGTKITVDSATLGNKGLEVIENSNIEYDFLDLNLACPVPKVTKGNGGSKWLTKLDEMYEMVKAVVEKSKKPVTAKVRLGWKSVDIENKMHRNRMSLPNCGKSNGNVSSTCASACARL